MTPEEFEQQVARLVAVLEGDGARVDWNARIPDPDNPDQLRQIDVAIRRGDALSIVECRLHSRPQDVKWVEELYGRRASLRAYMSMGVSSSGFTTGAWHKAAALGVFLRELNELRDDEIRSWGRGTKVRMSYVHFKRVALFLVPTDVVRLVRPNPRTLFLRSDGTRWPLDELFRQMANKLAEEEFPEGVVRMQAFPRDFHIGSVPVPEVVLQVEWRWVHRDLHLPPVLGFRAAGGLAR